MDNTYIPSYDNSFNAPADPGIVYPDPGIGYSDTGPVGNDWSSSDPGYFGAPATDFGSDPFGGDSGDDCGCGN